MKIELVSVNTAQPKTIYYQDKPVVTGIYKTPVQGKVKVSQYNLEGDGQADLQVHGGTNKAVYVYPFEHYDYWQNELNRSDLDFGQFGENFTISGATESQVHVGDIYKVGTAVFEVTQPRTPCFKLAIKMQLPAFPRVFLQSGRLGFYMKVVETGEVCAKDIFEAVAVNDHGLTITDIWNLALFETSNKEDITRALELNTLGPEWRMPLEKKL